MKRKIIFLFILPIVIILAILIFAVKITCAHEAELSCTPTLPIPSNQFLPNITPTNMPLPSILPTIIPTNIPAESTITPTPIAGESATISIPTSAPNTGRAETKEGE